MLQNNKNSWYAVVILMGTIVGAGVFGIPYAVWRPGLILGLILLVALGLITLYVNLLYGEVALRTPGKHRLVGFARKYFNKKGQVIATATSIIGLYGSFLAYLVLGGIFLYNLFNPYLRGSLEIYSLIFFLLGALGIILGIKVISRAELIMVGLLLVTLLVIVILGIPKLQGENMAVMHGSKFFFPYGVILFALGGASAIPELVEVLERRSQKIKKAILLGTFIPLLVYLIFTIWVVGITGPRVSQDTISSLKNYLGWPALYLGSLFGFLAVITSFFTLGLNLKKIFWYDYKLNQHFASLLVLAVPLLLFILGLRDFIKIISLVGVFMGGIEGILIVMLFRAARKKGKKKVSYRILFPGWLPYVIMGVFVLGILLEIYYYLK